MKLGWRPIQGARQTAGSATLAGLAVALLVLLPAGARSAPSRGDNGDTQPAAVVVPLDEFSPAFLGMYRKVMEIEGEIRRHTARYGVDFDLARAVCLYESGGNADLTSRVGADGFFQVMPATFRELGVSSNIEAGVKYLGQMVQRFGREDRAIAAYNAGPGRVGRNGGLPLETLQYVLGVGYYRSVLKAYEGPIRHHASRLRLAVVEPGDSWDSLGARLGLSAAELRLHNPFLVSRSLRPGQTIAYPPESRPGLLRPGATGTEYSMRHGDNYLHLAFALEVEPEALRAANGLWQVQAVPAGTTIYVPERSATRLAPVTPPPPVREPRTHRVERGDTLSALAQRYGTSIAAIREANNLAPRAHIRPGQSLRMPGR